uniref:ZSWIM1/3 RNaseH-like domain-containing protein n=1 Tax=Amphimedon queenslandica TaxID=400682 RepID=A0A1X7UAH2_AMPQE
MQNMKAKLRELSSKGLNDAKLLLQKLNEALEQDSLSRGNVLINEDYTLEVLYFQSGHIRNLYEKFPEIFLVEGTYNVNGIRMPLYCLLVEDGYADGQSTTEPDQLVRHAYHRVRNETGRSNGVPLVKDAEDDSSTKTRFFNCSSLYKCHWYCS